VKTLVAVLLVLAAGVAAAQTDAECQKRNGATSFRCEKAPGNCRSALDSRWLEDKEKGVQLDVRFASIFRVQAGDVALQPMYESVKLMQTRLHALFDDWNRCIVTDDEYRAREDAITGFHRGLAGEVERLNALAAELERTQTAQKSASTRLDELERTQTALKKGVSTLSKTLAVQIAGLEASQQAQSEQARKALRVELAKFQQSVDDQFASWDVRVQQLIDDRYEELRAEILALVNSLAEQVRLMNAGQLEADRWVLNVSGGAVWLEGEPRASADLAFETLRSGTGFLSGISFLYGASWVSWTHHDTYSTLPGAPDGEIDQNASFLAGTFGLKWYFPLGRATQAYIGANGGLLAQQVDRLRVGLVGQPFAGLAFAFGRARAGLELRYGAYGYWARQVEFNPFGDSSTHYAMRFAGGPALVATFSPYSW
jgi:hypothetical protein